jgi:adenylate kinase
MRQRIVAVTGVSGVGKTTCLNFVAKRIGFQHLQASALIQSARASQSVLPVSHDDLRKQDIDQNQALLLSGFAHKLVPQHE